MNPRARPNLSVTQATQLLLRPLAFDILYSSRLKMRLAALAAALCGAMTAMCVGAQPAPQSLSAGLVAHYRFDGDLSDTSGNSLQLSGPAYAFVPSPIGGNALLLSSTGTSVAPVMSPMTSLLPAGNSNRTVCVWFHISTAMGAVAETCLVSWGTVAAGGTYSTFSLRPASRSLFAWGAWADLSSGFIAAFVPNKWSHACMVYESPMAIEIFFDGESVLRAPPDSNVAWNTPASSQLAVGGNCPGLPLFTGLLDDVRIYNRVLGRDEIAALATPPTPTPSPSPTAVPPSCPASAYRAFPAHDIDGAVASVGIVTTERQCREACCASPACDAYTLDMASIYRQTTALCYLKANVTQLIPSSAHSVGVKQSALAGL